MDRKATRENSRQVRETEILEAACRVIRRSGYHGARMADIATEAGISYGLAYHYFQTKEGVFEAIAERWWGPLFDALAAIETRSDGVEAQLEAVISYFLDVYKADQNLVHVVITELSRTSANLTPQQLEKFQKLISTVERIIRRAQKYEQLRSDLNARYLATSFLGAVETLLSSMVLVNQPIKNDAMKARICNGVMSIFLFGAKQAPPQ